MSIGSILTAGLDAATGTGREWGEAHERSGRWRSLAATWFHKSLHNLRYCAELAATPAQRSVTGWEAERLLDSILGQAELLVPVLNEDDLEQVEKGAQDLYRAVRDRRRAVLLANVEGRTPEEAAEFSAKAAELHG